MPIGVIWRDGAPEIDWCLTAGERFNQPFFDDSVRDLVTRPFNRVFRRRTTIAAAEELVAEHPGLTPSGFIFHMSRCGSTLVSQMLAAREDSVVLAEPMAIDSMLRPPVPVPDERHAAWIRTLILAMGQPRFGERHYIIKFDCWHVFFLPLIARAFPNVPRLFLYREPRAVLASHLRQRGVQTVPGMLDPALFGIPMSEAATMPPAEYCARILGRILEAAPLERLVHYRSLPGAVFDTIVPAFGMLLTPNDLAVMGTASGRYSKQPNVGFSTAAEAPPIPANSPADKVVAAFMDPPYRALERRRCCA